MDRRQGYVARLAMTVALCAVLIIPGEALGATVRVRASGNDWEPKVRRIVRGDKVVWRNPTGKRHDVVSRGSNWSYRVVLDPGESSAPRQFGKVGRYRYRCTLHSGIVDGVCQGMCGTIRVRRP